MKDTPPPDQSIVVVQVTDPHLYEDPSGCLLGVQTDASLRGVLRHIIEYQPDIGLLLATGDISQDGSLAAQQRFLRLAADVPAPLRGLPGNHDAGQAFHQAWGEQADPVKDIGRWRLIMLDTRVPGSNAGRLAEAQLELLLSAAQEAHDKHILVALHHNPIAMGSAWLDTMTIANASALFDILERLPRVRALLWGHVHQEYDGFHECADRAGRQSPGVRPPARRGLRLLSTPSTCVQFTPGSRTFSLDSAAPGYRWLVLHPDGRLDTGVSRVDGLGLKPSLDSAGY
ncbi:metallophosphoesterase [Castellaniella sp. GW247-6E4]|uniref:metallophosphoesterase n=1 Tax=Castellaniella sp. GW247-6E4 TaxID=3140380 RepID=UPI003314E076